MGGHKTVKSKLEGRQTIKHIYINAGKYNTHIQRGGAGVQMSHLWFPLQTETHMQLYYICFIMRGSDKILTIFIDGGWGDGQTIFIILRSSLTLNLDPI